jgi:hypothetical protein
MLEGSGTDATVVSPPEIRVDSLKSDFPVFTVSCTLTPLTVIPLIVPVMTPVKV